VGVTAARPRGRDVFSVAPFYPGATIQITVIFSETSLRHRMRELGDQGLRRMAKLEMSRNEPCREIDPSLPVEGVEYVYADRLNIGGQIVELFAVLARDANRRHIEIASKVEKPSLRLLLRLSEPK
jgi:hypothetical protein